MEAGVVAVEEAELGPVGQGGKGGGEAFPVGSGVWILGVRSQKSEARSQKPEAGG